jgi:hypothetical protein
MVIFEGFIMHVLITMVILLIVYKKADWRNLRNYGLTIFYMITCNLLYNLICHDHLLWQYQPDIIKNMHFPVDLLYTFITLPAITLLYLSNYPFNSRIRKQFKYLLFWVLGSVIITFLYVKTGMLHFNHGYKPWMDFLFYPVMYSLLRLHHTRPMLTYGISIIVIVFMINYFNVPIK